MRYLVNVEPSHEAATKLDAGPGGPGPLFGYIAERFKPEAFFVEADRRAAWWIIDFPNEAAIVEFTHVALARAGTHPHLRPIVLGNDVKTILPKAYADAQRAP
ncbi:MAG TPA: hypothetical protein VHB79_30485 [Polyangiaceae bacterium]|nr:hypothetical protein [Polyangiaceae bacterium]